MRMPVQYVERADCAHPFVTTDESLAGRTNPPTSKETGRCNQHDRQPSLTTTRAGGRTVERYLGRHILGQHG